MPPFVIPPQAPGALALIGYERLEPADVVAALQFDVEGYRHLVIRCSAYSTRNSTIDNMQMTVNEDTSDIYSTNAATATSQLTVGTAVGASFDNVERVNNFHISLSIGHPFHKAGVATRTAIFSTSTTGGAPVHSGLYIATIDEIETIEFFCANANFGYGTEFYVFGLEVPS